jgi:hypothetical protein
MADIPQTCPHCGSRLRKWLAPLGSDWTVDFFFVCFNDDCPYYGDGWDWMKQQYRQLASYRYMINPVTGVASPLAVWSASAMREMIAEEDRGGDA